MTPTSYLSQQDSEELYGIILARQGVIVHSYGTSIFIETKEGNTINFVIMGGANSIASAAQFMAVKAQAELKKSGKAAANTKRGNKGKKKGAAAVAAPAPAPKRNTRASKKAGIVNENATPARRGGKQRTLIVLDGTPTPDFTRHQAGNTPPVGLSSDSPALIGDNGSDVDSDSDASYVEYNDMGLTQEGCLVKGNLSKIKQLMAAEADAFLDECEADREELKKYGEHYYKNHEKDDDSF